MKKKIIIAVSVILFVATLITGWVFWKISKNPDKNIFVDKKTEYIADDGDKLVYSPDSKTLTAIGEEIDIDIDFYELNSNPSYADWFEYAEKLVFAEGVTRTNTDFSDFENVKTVEICSTMKSLNEAGMPPREKYVVSQENDHYYTDEAGVLYYVGYIKISSHSTETWKQVSLIDVPYNSPLTEFTIPDDVNHRIEPFALDTANLKKIIIGKDGECPFFYGFHLLSGIECYEVHPENKYYSTDEQGVFYSKDKTAIYGIPSTVEEFVIPENARFEKLDYFEHINCNTGVKKITVPNGFGGFSDLFYFANLEEIVISENNPDYRMVDGVIFTKDMTKIVSYPNSKKADYYEIPAGVVTVGYHCFGPQKLKKLVISDSVRKIDFRAFDYAIGIESLVIGKGVETIEFDTPPFVENVLFNPFQNCENLREIIVDPENAWFCSNEDKALFTKDMKNFLAFPADSEKKVVNVPTQVEIIHAPFRNCKNIKVINLGKNVKEMYFYEFGEYLNYHGFENCSSLEEVNVSHDNPVYGSKDGVLYLKENGCLMLYPQGKTDEELTISKSPYGYGAIYKNKYLKRIYVSWEKPEDFYENGYFGCEPYPWIGNFYFPYEIYYSTSDVQSFEK